MLRRNSKETVPTLFTIIGAYFGTCIRIIVSAIRIVAQQIPGLSRTFHLDFQVLEILHTQCQDDAGGVGTLYVQTSTGQSTVWV